MVIAAETSSSAIPIKLLKWPPTVSGFFAADAKRTLELEMEPTAPSLDECKEMVKKAYGNMSSIKIYFHDGFEVMPVVREEDFTFCIKKFERNYANHVDMNRLYIVVNPFSKSNEPERQPPKLYLTSTGEHSNNGSKADLNFSVRVKKAFPTVEILPSNKFKCSCGHIGALNGERRMGNIKRHVNTTCRLGGNRVARTLMDYFGKCATPVNEEQN